jgi:hypothetical protein
MGLAQQKGLLDWIPNGIVILLLILPILFFGCIVLGKFVAKRRVVSLLVFILIGAGLGALAWFLTVSAPHSKGATTEEKSPTPSQPNSLQETPAQGTQQGATAVRSTGGQLNLRVGTMEGFDTAFDVSGTGKVDSQVGQIIAPNKPAEIMKKPKDKAAENYNITSFDQRGGFTGVNKGTVNLAKPPRVITHEQREAFLTINKPYPKGKVSITIGSQTEEAHDYAVAIKSLLMEAGYDVGNQFGWIQVFGGSPLIGLRVGTASDKDAPPHARPLVGTLRDSGIPADLVLDHRVIPEAVNITVGSNPE